jgi:hypothetical protein
MPGRKEGQQETKQCQIRDQKQTKQGDQDPPWFWRWSSKGESQKPRQDAQQLQQKQRRQLKGENRSRNQALKQQQQQLQQQLGGDQVASAAAPAAVMKENWARPLEHEHHAQEGKPLLLWHWQWSPEQQQQQQQSQGSIQNAVTDQSTAAAAGFPHHRWWQVQAKRAAFTAAAAAATSAPGWPPTLGTSVGTHMYEEFELPLGKTSYAAEVARIFAVPEAILMQGLGAEAGPGAEDGHFGRGVQSMAAALAGNGLRSPATCDEASKSSHCQMGGSYRPAAAPVTAAVAVTAESATVPGASGDETASDLQDHESRTCRAVSMKPSNSSRRRSSSVSLGLEERLYLSIVKHLPFLPELQLQATATDIELVPLLSKAMPGRQDCGVTQGMITTTKSQTSLGKQQQQLLLQEHQEDLSTKEVVDMSSSLLEYQLTLLEGLVQRRSLQGAPTVKLEGSSSSDPEGCNTCIIGGISSSKSNSSDIGKMIDILDDCKQQQYGTASHSTFAPADAALEASRTRSLPAGVSAAGPLHSNRGVASASASQGGTLTLPARAEPTESDALLLNLPFDLGAPLTSTAAGLTTTASRESSMAGIANDDVSDHSTLEEQQQQEQHSKQFQPASEQQHQQEQHSKQFQPALGQQQQGQHSKQFRAALGQQQQQGASSQGQQELPQQRSQQVSALQLEESREDEEMLRQQQQEQQQMVWEQGEIEQRLGYALGPQRQQQGWTLPPLPPPSQQQQQHERLRYRPAPRWQAAAYDNTLQQQGLPQPHYLQHYLKQHWQDMHNFPHHHEQQEHQQHRQQPQQEQHGHQQQQVQQHQQQQHRHKQQQEQQHHQQQQRRQQLRRGRRLPPSRSRTGSWTGLHLLAALSLAARKRMAAVRAAMAAAMLSTARSGAAAAAGVRGHNAGAHWMSPSTSCGDVMMRTSRRKGEIYCSSGRKKYSLVAGEEGIQAAALIGRKSCLVGETLAATAAADAESAVDTHHVWLWPPKNSDFRQKVEEKEVP